MSDSTNDPTASDGNTPNVVGQRRLFYFNDNGQPAYQISNLTVEDFLNPQAGDEFFHGELHNQCARILASMLHHHYRYSPTTSVHSKPKLIWPDSSLAQPMPDVAIVNNLSDPQRPRPILDLASEQNVENVEGEVHVRAIFEVTSPLLADSILETKRTLYEHANVAEYWIIDTGLRPGNEEPHFTIIGYQLQDGHYEAMAPKSENRWESKACRLWLTVSADHQSFMLGDLRTGKAFPMPADDDDPSISAQAEASRRAQSIADQLKL